MGVPGNGGSCAVPALVRRTAVMVIVPVAVLGLALLAPGVAAAAGGSNLLPNGTFDGGSTSGWRATNATLSVTSPGFGGTAHAAKLTLSKSTTSYNMFANPVPVTSVPAGEQFTGTGEVLGVSGRSVCLILREISPGGSVVQTVQQCVTAAGSWQAIGPATLTDQTAGDSVGYVISQTGARTGDSFEADSLSLTDADTTAPTAPANLAATAASSSEIDLSWSASTDPDFSGVYGYAIYRDGGGTPLATVPGSATSYKDTSVSAGSTHNYQVAAFDYAGNFSTPSNLATATTPAAPLAAQWNMDETSGTTMFDSSGNNNNGTLHGPVQVGLPGPAGHGTAYSFSGQSDVDVPFSPTLVAGSANVTISFWFATTHLPTSGDYDLVRMGTYPNPEYKVELVGTGQIGCTFHGSISSHNATGGSGLADGNWHYVQCIKTASQIQLWIDGTEVKVTNAVIGSVSPTEDAFLGAHGNPGSSSGFDWYQGKLDDVSIAIG